jgi:hypothetical protein
MTTRETVFAFAIALGACGEPTYVYSPETANAVSASGQPAARIDIPQERPQGSIQIVSYGVTTLRQGETTVRALHVRETVSNDGDDTPWQVNTTHQLVAIPGEGQSRPLFANGDTHTLPIITIPRRARHVIDLYFPLPVTIHADSALPRFEVLWQVDTAARTVASRTGFDRQEVEVYAYAPYAYPYYGYGPYWWYDPWWPTGVAFVHSPHVVIAHHGPVTVGHFDGHFVSHAPAMGGHGGMAGGHVAGGGHVGGGGHHR